MTSSTASNTIIASLARNSPSHRSILTPRSTFRSRSSSSAHPRRNRPIHRRMSISNVTPVTIPVDVNNNNSTTMPVVASANRDNSITLDRVAILKAFAASQRSNVDVPDQIITATSVTSRVSRFEKPTSYREARRLKQLRQPSLPDPAVEQEFIRLRDSVPSIAGSKVSDLTIINEAISLICDLESQLIRKLKCQNLSTLHSTSN